MAEERAAKAKKGLHLFRRMLLKHGKRGGGGGVAGGARNYNRARDPSLFPNPAAAARSEAFGLGGPPPMPSMRRGESALEPSFEPLQHGSHGLSLSVPPVGPTLRKYSSAPEVNPGSLAYPTSTDGSGATDQAGYAPSSSPTDLALELEEFAMQEGGMGWCRVPMGPHLRYRSDSPPTAHPQPPTAHRLPFLTQGHHSLLTAHHHPIPPIIHASPSQHHR